MNFSGETSGSKKQYSENLIQYLIDRGSNLSLTVQDLNAVLRGLKVR